MEFPFIDWVRAEVGAQFLVAQIPLAVIAGVVLGVVMLPFALRLHRRIGARRMAQTGLSAALTVAGTIPPIVVGIVWYARQVDYLWAINGPFPFRYVGADGTVWTWTFLCTVAFTAACWGAAAALAVSSYRVRK